MVTYQKWTQVAFNVARRKGMETSQEQSQSLISVAAEVWRERKSELSAATQSEAERIADEEITVR